MGAAKILWDDEWIRCHVNDYQSYKDMASAYSEYSGRTISTSAIKARAMFLGIKKPRKNCRHYTSEQIEWLKINYPVLGCRECMKQFNEIFNENRTFHSMKNFGQWYGLSVNKSVANVNKTRNAHAEGSKRQTRQIGSQRMECGRLVIKATDGKWHPSGRLAYTQKIGKIPKGYVVTHLDGDTTNIDADNLMAIPNTYMGLLQRYNLRSESKEITKTGISWCRLYMVFAKNACENSKKIYGG